MNVSLTIIADAGVMRIALVLFTMIALQAAAAWGAGDTGVARPGASYASTPMEAPAACERACRDDGLCMAWSHAEGVCELKAVVPAPLARAGASSGLSQRAPGSVRQQFAASVPAALPQPLAPPVTVTASLEDALLGGPEASQELRPALGN